MYFLGHELDVGGDSAEHDLRQILTNPAYVGERYGVRDAHASLVSRRAWNAAQAALAARARAA